MCGAGRMSEILRGQCGLHQHCVSKTGGGSHAKRCVAKDLCPSLTRVLLATLIIFRLMYLFCVFQVCEVSCCLWCWRLWWAHSPPSSTVPVLSSPWTSTQRFAARPVKGSSWLPAGKTMWGFSLNSDGENSCVSLPLSPHVCVRLGTECLSWLWSVWA